MQANAYTDADARYSDSNTDAYSHADSYVYSDSYSDCNRNGNPNSHANRNTYAYSPSDCPNKPGGSRVQR